MNIKRKALTVILGMVFSVSVFAGSGKTVVPHWMSTGITATSVWVSNITDHTLDVTITFYDMHGNALPADLFYNFQNNNTQIAPGSTGYVTIHADSWGYAVINWNNIGSDDDTYGLVSYAQRSDGTTNWRQSIVVNDGRPF